MIPFFAITLLIVIYIWKYYENVRRYPKGPTPLPLIGNLLTYDWPRAHEQLSELSKTYGNVFTIWLPRPFVVVMDYDDVKEAFKGDDFDGRSGVFPDIAFMNIKNGGIIWSDGESWKVQRRTSLHMMRDFGMGKNLMESQVSESMTESLDYLDTLKRESVDLRWTIQIFVSNVIAKTVFGIKYNPKECEAMKDFSNLLCDYIEVVKNSKLFFLSQTWPWLNNIPLYRKLAFGEVEKITNPLKQMVRDMTDEAIKDYDPTHEPECLAQAYVQRMQTNPDLSHEQLVNVCMDFLLAGMETSSTTLRWGALFMAQNQEVQDKMRAEISKEIGFDSMPQMVHKPKLPYCTAVINEIQRCANIIPLNVIHRATRDSSIGGHPIPKDTFVLGQLSHIMKYSERFSDGIRFRPERFLMEDGVTPNKETLEHLVPFSIGRRQCAGEALARVELFIGLVSLIQRYKLEPMPGVPIDLSPIYGQVILPKCQSLRVTPVNANNY